MILWRACVNDAKGEKSPMVVVPLYTLRQASKNQVNTY